MKVVDSYTQGGMVSDAGRRDMDQLIRMETERGRGTMKNKSRMIVLMLAAMVIITLVFPLVGAERVYACSCAAYPEIGNELDSRSVVFAGEVSSIDTLGRNDEIVSSADPVLVTFEVSKVWKGSIEKETVVRTVRYEESCGYTFSLGNSYLVFADEKDGVVRTGLCTGTQPLTAFNEQQLDDLVKPYEPQDERQDTDGRIFDHGRQVGMQQSYRPVDTMQEGGVVTVMHEKHERDKSTPAGYIFLAFAFVAILSAAVGFKIGGNRQ
jgi:Tissue inhibitor of metalloproteinase.